MFASRGPPWSLVHAPATEELLAAAAVQRRLRMPEFRVGADIGGTFTDLIFLRPDGPLDRRKVPSTPDDYPRRSSHATNIFRARACYRGER